MNNASFTPTDRTDEFGATIYRLKWGKTTIDAISGLPGYESCNPTEDYPGSCRPIPEGKYSVGKPVAEPLDDCDPAIGPDWIPLSTDSDVGGRGGFLIHRDWNYVLHPGTAGCIAPVRHADMDKIVAAVGAGEFDTIVVNYGYGVV
jgi:hypothetical protein